MLAAPIIPTMPPTNHKRRLSNRLGNNTGIHGPNPKRRRLNSSNVVPDDEHTENNRLLRYDDSQTLLLKMLPNASQKVPPLGRTAHMKEVQLSVVFPDNAPLSHLSNDLQSVASPVSKNHSRSSRRCQRMNGFKKNGKINQLPFKPQTKRTSEVNDVHIMDGKCNYKSQPYESQGDHLNKRSSSCVSSDVDSDCSESQGRIVVPKIKIKQPAIFLMKMNHHVKKSHALSGSHLVRPEVSSVVIGGYVHRMANLNARACVAAFLQPERKRTSKVTKLKGHKKTTKTTKSICKSKSTLCTTINHTVPDEDISKTKAVVLKLNGIESAIPVLRFEANGIEIPTCAVIVQGLDGQDEDESKVAYNKLGLLYNGDTIHPHSQVFLTQSMNRVLQLPNRVVPTIVPSRLSTVRRAARKASSRGVVHSTKRKLKKNNGWRPLGEPIKVMRICEGSSKITRKYYAGVKRRTEEIYVRDSVVIKAGSEKDENPYVAKVGSIWQEPDGSLLMTTFWYYRTSDVEVQSAGIECVERELLASQHHDVNSVECIEDKCYVLGYTQHCRYRASVLKRKISTAPSSNSIIPKFANKTVKPECDHQLDSNDDSFSLVELDPKKQKVEDLSPSLSELQDVDPSLVFLCYRGFNHVSGKLQTGKTLAARV